MMFEIEITDRTVVFQNERTGDERKLSENLKQILKFVIHFEIQFNKL